MRSRLLTLSGCLALIGSAVLAQTPTIQPNGVVNAAGSRSVIAPGSLISIFGSGLASGLSISNSVPVSSKLGDVDSVMIGGTAAPLVFVSDSRINAQVPWVVPPGQANVGVSPAGVASSPMAVQVSQFAPALFSFNLGTQQASALTAQRSIVGPPGCPSSGPC